MICFVDLPNLRSIDSRECSFYHPRVVTVESITIHCIRIAFRYSKSPICRSTWFIRGSSIEINFEYCVDWFDFIHRCFFHSLWFSQYQAVSPSLDLHILFYSILFYSTIIVCSMFTFYVCSKSPPIIERQLFSTCHQCDIDSLQLWSIDLVCNSQCNSMLNIRITILCTISLKENSRNTYWKGCLRT